MAKRVKVVLTLQLPAGKATAAYPVGPALGQHGVNIMGFVKEYNERTAAQHEHSDRDVVSAARRACRALTGAQAMGIICCAIPELPRASYSAAHADK